MVKIPKTIWAMCIVTAVMLVLGTISLTSIADSTIENAGGASLLIALIIGISTPVSYVLSLVLSLVNVGLWLRKDRKYLFLSLVILAFDIVALRFAY
jgi:hypothetical protein